MSFKIPLAAAAAAAATAYWLAPFAHPAVPVQPAAARAPSDLIRLGEGNPQLAYLKIAAVAAQPLPLADPVGARIAYDETRTTRIASPVLGRVLAAPVQAGDRVRAGEVLAILDSPDLATAQADLRKAEADGQRKRLALERARQLAAADVLARRELENSEADYRQAEAETRRARQRVRNLHGEGADDGRFGLRAPIAGTVAERQINPGQEVRPDQAAPLAVVSDLGHLWAVADVPERMAVELHPGQEARFETDAFAGQQFRARVARIGVAVDPVTRRVQVRCELDNADGRLKPEMYARVAFIGGAAGARAVEVPNTALFTEGAYSYVFVETRRGEFAKRQVTIRLGGVDRSYIGAGLAGGERVVVEGALLLNAEVAGHAR